MKLFNWFRKLTFTHCEFLAVHWLFYCYFHSMLMLILNYQLLTYLKNYSTKTCEKINNWLFIYEPVNRLYFEQKITSVNRITLTS